MRYLHVTWEHNLENQPRDFYMELNEERIQERVLEIFLNGEIAYATIDKEYNTFLAKEEYPDIEEINSMEEIDSTEKFTANEITKEEFNELWSLIDENND